MIRNVHLEKCIHVSNDRVSLSECNPHSPEQRWSWDSNGRSIVSLKSSRCLGVNRMHEFSAVKLTPCGDNTWQRWDCTKKSHVTLHGKSLHLNAKHGTNKIFVSQEKDKFSKWKTMSNEPICGNGMAGRERHGRIEVVEIAEIPVLFYKPEVVNSSEQMSAMSRSSGAETATATAPPDRNSTAMVGSIQNLFGEDGTNWKLGMLILSPLAFTIGLLILVLNIHCNKKRKTLCALKSYPQNWHGVNSTEEQAPLSVKVGTAQNSCLASRSPSLKHGEILIEWKDGTVTPLFDNFSYQTD
ncbi:uncharacterized protein [Ambystoma mexicanum]